MAHRQPARRDLSADLLGKLEKSKDVGDRRAILADRRRDGLLRQLKLVGEAPIGQRLVDRIQVLALDVLDERHLEERTFLPRSRRRARRPAHGASPASLRGAPAPLARDDLEPVADLAHDDRLNDAVRLDRAREILEGRLVHRDRAAGSRSARADRCRPRSAEVRGSGASGMSALRPFPRAGRLSIAETSGDYAAGRRPRARALPRARARYASAPRDFTSYRITGMPWLGASPSRTLRGMTVRNTFSLKNWRTSPATCWPRFVRSSNIVSSTPSMSSDGLSADSHAAHRADEIGEPLEREILAVKRNQHRVGGDERIQRQQPERRRTIDEDVIEVVAQWRQQRAQPFLACGSVTSSISAPVRFRSAGISWSRSMAGRDR